MSMIYLLLTKPDFWFEETLQGVRKDPYTHVALSFTRELSPMYSFGRKYGVLPFPAGMIREEPGRRIKDVPCVLLGMKTEEKIYRKVTEEVDSMVRWAGEYQYNFWGLLFCRMKLIRDRPGYYFDAQFVGEVLEKSGAVTLPKPACLMRPADFEEMPGFVRLFEGSVQDLIGGENVRQKGRTGDAES